MGELADALAAALDGPDADSHYECTHCGAVADGWFDDCPKCGGTVMRIVTDHRDDPALTGR
ncbi:hypothetical protein NGM10_04955 [Halorussus salilacus]|uniref:hypothetical protein n=1 Tax=Halorussus salilacus TaxID=2953750 RepID=UPI0020A05BA8|nr:hypothetical protein [Halorussus salilacus]USZ69088.1 hypothetical protein NGM10_04955 [Halorussus salilacus]